MNDETKNRELKNEVNNYQQTVKALIAFSSFVVHDGSNERPNAYFGFGRKMETSSRNNLCQTSQITPDLVAQKNLDYGIVGEVKKSLPSDKTYWKKSLGQLRKYDDDLKGWWTDDEKVKQSNSIMLIHQSRSRAFKRFLESQKTLDPNSVGQNTSIIEFNDSSETALYYFFRLEYGSILDNELNGKLDDGISIPLEKVLKTYSNINYYDSKPPLVLLLTNLWSDVLPSRIQEGERDDITNVVKIKVTIDEITKEMQEAYGSKNLSSDQRSVEFPKPKWIKNALEELVKLKLALPLSNDIFEYEVHYRHFNKDIQERFIDYYMEHSKKQKDNNKKQELLFNNEEN